MAINWEIVASIKPTKFIGPISVVSTGMEQTAAPIGTH